jgi:hypothetical protein
MPAVPRSNLLLRLGRVVCRVAAILFLACNAAVFAQAVDPPDAPPSIATDKNSYAPGELITIVGEGWTPGETVTIELDPVAQNRTPHTLHSTADGDGNFA